MKHTDDFIQLIMQKTNVKSGLLLLSLLLIIAGIYMCLQQIESTGSIDIKASFLSGKITAGSLGLLVIFLAAVVAVAAQRLASKERPIEITHKDLKLTGVNLVEREWKKIIECIQEHEKYHLKAGTSDEIKEAKDT